VSSKGVRPGYFPGVPGRDKDSCTPEKTKEQAHSAIHRRRDGRRNDRRRQHGGNSGRLYEQGDQQSNK
jgi:hypothetical protein